MDFGRLRKLFIAMFVIGFAIIYGVFLWRIMAAPDGVPPALDERLVAMAAVLSGALGSAFAVALGVDDKRTGPSMTIPSVSWWLAAGIYLYGIVGVLTVVVYLFNLDETPGSLKALALCVVGYGASIITNAYRAILPKPAAVPPQSLPQPPAR
jgi:hypothetical protein